MPKPMDNFQVKVVSYGDDHLEAAICLCLNENDRVQAWSINEDAPWQLCLFGWVSDSDKEKVTRLPSPMDRKTIIAFVKGWLREQSYLKEPDHDGSNSKGFTVTNGAKDGWASHGLVLTVEPCWAMHGK